MNKNEVNEKNKETEEKGIDPALKRLIEYHLRFKEVSERGRADELQ